MLGLVPLNQLKSLSGDFSAIMLKNKQKNIGTSSLKVKPKKRPGLIKQLSQPFFMTSNKKNKTPSGAEPEKNIACVSKEDLGLFGGFDDMFLPDRTALSESVFLSPEIEKYLNSGKSPLTLEIPHREKCSSGDSGYMSPPNIGDVTSPTSSIPAKGILKKKGSSSPDSRSNSPLFTIMSPDSRLYMSSPALNGHVTTAIPNRDRSMSPCERPMSPLCDDSIENALGFLDDVIDQENVKKTVKKSVSFGQLAEVKNFTSDSSDNDICDEFKPIKKNVSFGDVENLKRKKDTINQCNKSFKKSVSFEDITVQRTVEDEIMRSVSCEELIPVHDSDSSLSDSEKYETENNQNSCSCEKVCEFEVEVKVIDIQPSPKGKGETDDENYSCSLLDTFNVMICHHPGCTKNNENRPMLLCKECDGNIHQRPEYTGHLVLDLPKRKSQHERTARFAHANSTPAFPNQVSVSSMDIEEIENDEGIEDGESLVAMETEQKLSKEAPDMGEVEKKLKRKKVVKAKRRHTTGAINHETFTMKIRSIDNEEEDIEIVAAEKNVSLREAIQPILERRRISLEVINVFVEASNTPLPLNCETFLLGGTTMYIKEKDGEPTLPSGSQSLSKATGSKLAGGVGKSSSAKSKSGMSRRESVIGRAQSMLEAPVSKQRRSSLQLPFQGFFPSPKLGEGSRNNDDSAGSLRSRRGVNLSIDDSSFPMALTVSPQGTLREVDTRKQKQPSKLTTLFSPLNKDKEKQDQLNELLNNYSSNGLPPFPSLVHFGHSQFDEAVFGIDADWRAIVDNSQHLTKRQQDQQEAVWELLHTEIQYIRSIRVISDLFLCVLLNLQNELLLNEIETEKLFNNIGDIATANSDFWRNHLYKVLEESRSSGALLNPSIMKEGFQKYNDIFQPYVHYCAKQKMCTDYMRSQYTENDLFKTFVIWAEAQKQCNRLKFTDLLVKPMQRLTKYSLLLQAILRKTDDDHQRRDLLEMIASVDRFVHHVNATLHQQHEEEKLQAIVDKIEAYDAVDAPNDECLKLIQPYNSNFNLTAPMPGCDATQTRALVMQSPLKMKEYQNRMDVEVMLFTDLMLICKASKRMDKYKIVKPPMRVDRIITHELKDKGCFLLIYVNEYHVPVSSFTFHADHNAVQIWITHIRKAQDLYREARMATSSSEKPTFPQTEIITEEVIGYTPLIYSESDTNLPLLQLTRCASEEPEGQRSNEVSSPINRSRSWNEMSVHSDAPMYSTEVHKHVYPPVNKGSPPVNKGTTGVLESEQVSRKNSSNHTIVQYSQSDPTVFSQYAGEGTLRVPNMSISAGTSESDMSTLPEFVDENIKSKLYQRRQSRTEKRYYTADAIQELNKTQDRDNSIYKRLSWNFPNGEAAGDKQGVLKHKTMSSDSVRSFHSSSGVSSTGSLHLSPEGDICEEDSDLGDYDNDNEIEMDLPHDLNEDTLREFHATHKSKSTPDIVSLMQDLNTHDMKDGICSIDLPSCEDPKQRLSHAQLVRMKKQLLLSSNVEASEV
ncbi:pleckstrin homology domain-containing family G member 5-like isoform X3 [Mercenaria mercenaria]|uniref:pleckstrin homology domain-containing family G member 5-like isoform X3 n=1 Tax=Mercenaria mercenaria TaxID=6596 RepID=UPI00234E3782|nr:pleckstrin homology domain-containing family G member 5-like isoform X3 [Mercenaria mercenaria]